MNKKIIAGLTALALFCGSVPAYHAFLNRASINASAVDADITEFLNGYTNKNNSTSVVTEIKLSGRTYAQGIKFGTTLNEFSTISYDVSSIKSLGFTAGHVDDTRDGSATLNIYLDDVKSEEIDLNDVMRLKDFTIDTSAASTIRFEMTSPGNFAIVDFKIDKAGSSNPCFIPSYSSSEAFLKRSFDASSGVSAYYNSDQSVWYSINKRKHYQGLTFKGMINDTHTISYNVEKVKTLSFSYGHVSSSGMSSGTLRIYLDNVEAESKPLTWSMAADEITLDVSKASVVRFEVAFSGSDTYALADFSVDGAAPEMSFTKPIYESSEDFLRSCYDSSNGIYYYAASDQSASFSMAGRSYYQGLTFSGTINDTRHISFNVENLKSISFTLGHVDGSGSGSGIFVAYLDGVKAAEYKLDSNSLWQEVALDISDASVLWFEVSFPASSSTYGLGDFKIDSMDVALPHDVPTYDSVEKLLQKGYNYEGTAYYYTNNTLKIDEKEYNGNTLGGMILDQPSITYNVEKIESMTFMIGYPDDASKDSGTLQIYKDNKLADEVAISSTMGIAKYALDTSDASTVRFKFLPSNSKTTIALVDYKLNEKITTPGLGEKTPTESADTGLFGDINGDGAINAKDANEILRYAAYVGTGGSMTLREYVAQ